MSYQRKVYRKQGGDELVIASGGKITAESGCTIERTVQKFVGGDAKVGATAGWTVRAASDRRANLLPASQTNSTLVIPIDCVKVGDVITGFSLIGQIESAGNAASITADLRGLTVAAADLADASVGAMAAPLSVTADTAVSAANAAKSGLTETVVAGKCYYLLVTATTAASTDIDLLGALITIKEQ